MSLSPKGAHHLEPPKQDQNWVTTSLNFHCRNIYYKDPALFKTQLTVDYYVDIIAYTFGVSRLALNVVSGQCYPELGASLMFLKFSRPPLQKALSLGTSS